LELGIALAVLCAAATQLGYLCKHRGATCAPQVRIQEPLRSARELLASRWFAIGMAVAAGAFVLHVVALALAPLSTVQAVLSTGVVMLAVLGNGLFGHAVTRQQWLGVGMTAAGLALLVLTLPAPDGTGSDFATPGLIAFEAATIVPGALLIAAPRMGAPDHHHGVLLGAAAGVLVGVSDVAVKALTGVAGDGLLGVLASPWLPLAVLAGLVAFLASARGFQEGEAVPVIASTSTAANLTCIVGGIVVFGDALAAGILLGVQLAAFALVAAAALVTPCGDGRPALQAA
jgi:multidrug transporter EmrE-like cation transporter